MAETKHCAGVIGLEECSVRVLPMAVTLVSMRGNPIKRWPKPPESRMMQGDVYALVAQVVAEIRDAVN